MIESYIIRNSSFTLGGGGLLIAVPSDAKRAYIYYNYEGSFDPGNYIELWLEIEPEFTDVSSLIYIGRYYRSFEAFIPLPPVFGNIYFHRNIVGGVTGGIEHAWLLAVKD